MSHNHNASTLALSHLLGGLTPEVFLREYWHKKPLLIRGAIPHFNGLLSAEELAGLACEEDVQSRLVTFDGDQWEVVDGPIDEATFQELPESGWTLLVQGVNHWLEEAANLLSLFNFIPHARLDDLMVSYAPEGGGVGPHFDSYDVFLLQGQGHREWRLSEQEDLEILEDAPLRILKRFNTEQTFVLEAGDMLYLPPKVAHWGIAKNDCMTYSIGFRAPTEQELVTQFLGFLQDKLQFSGRYADPELSLQSHPGEIADSMVNQVKRIVDHIRWDESMVSRFLGAYLSEPKPHLIFTSPKRPIKQERFEKALTTTGCELDLASLALFDHHRFYLNGEEYSLGDSISSLLISLADHRKLEANTIEQSLHLATAEARRIFFMQTYRWYSDGYIHLLK